MSYRPHPSPTPLLIGYDPVRDLPPDHLARLVETVVEEALTVPAHRRRRGNLPFDPRLPIKVLIYGYATGIRSSRRLEQACMESLPYLFLTRGDTPSYRTLCRTRLEQSDLIEQVWISLFAVAERCGMKRLGRIVVDSSKLRADASPEAVLTPDEYQAVREELAQILAEAQQVDEQEERAGVRGTTRLGAAVEREQMREILRRVRKQLAPAKRAAAAAAKKERAAAKREAAAKKEAAKKAADAQKEAAKQEAAAKKAAAKKEAAAQKEAAQQERLAAKPAAAAAPTEGGPGEQERAARPEGAGAPEPAAGAAEAGAAAPAPPAEAPAPPAEEGPPAPVLGTGSAGAAPRSGAAARPVAPVAADPSAERAPRPPRAPLTSRMRARVEAAITALDEALAEGRKHLCLTDPDARMMGEGRSRRVQECYSFEVAVDREAGLLVAAGVTQDASDNARLEPLVAQAQAHEPEGVQAADADCGYFSGGAVGRLIRAGVDLCVPDCNTAGDLHRGQKAGTIRAQGRGSVVFEYDAATDCYRCPEGNELRREQRREEAGQQVTEYRAHRSCAGCPLAKQCLTQPGAKHRMLKVSEYEPELTAARERFNEAEHRERYRHRGEVVETVFGFVRGTLGYVRFMLRGKERVECEARLIKVGYQLRKVQLHGAGG